MSYPWVNCYPHFLGFHLEMDLIYWKSMLWSTKQWCYTTGRIYPRSVLLIMWYGKPNSIEALNHLRVYPVCLGWCLLCPVMAGEKLMSFGIVFTTVLIAHPSEWSYGPSRKDEQTRQIVFCGWCRMVQDFFCPNLQIMNTCASTSWYCIYGIFMGFGWFWHLLIWIWQWNSEEL